MVRSYKPQSFKGDVEVNTNNPPQGTPSGIVIIELMSFNVSGEIMEYNVTAEDMEYN